MTDPRAFFNDAYFDSFQTKKYRNPNPLQRKQIAKLLGRVVELARPLNPHTILDAGAGEGFLTGSLAHEFPQAKITVVDSGPSDLELLRKRVPQVDAIQADLQTFDLGRRFDLLIATEVLEHLPKAADALKHFARHADRIIVTVPWEPLFMLANVARGKNISRFGNDIEHVNHWWPGRLKRFLAAAYTVDTVETIFPWIVAAGHRRNI